MAVSVPEEDLRHKTPHIAMPDLNPVATVMLKSWQQLVAQGHLISQRPQTEALGWEERSGAHPSRRAWRRRVVSR